MKYKKLKSLVNTLINNPLLASVFIFVVLSFLVSLISIPFYQSDSYNFIENIVAEAHGTLFDLLIIGILILWFNKSSEKKKTISDSLSEIEDFRDWHAEEAKYRVLGHIRRLNHYKVTDIPLHHYRLNNIKMARLNLKNSQLSHLNVSKSKAQDLNLTNTNLHQADFEKSYLTDIHFDKAVLTGARFTQANVFKCHFKSANLLLADFTNARLIDVCFDDADLTGANFEGAEIINCSFHNTVGYNKDLLSKTKNFIEKKEESKEASAGNANTPAPLSEALPKFNEIIESRKAS